MGRTKADKVIIGAGIYGLYAALRFARKDKGSHIVVFEADKDAVSRATYANQARVHLGYHYPRSISTVKKTSNYFRRFTNDFRFCINGSFRQIYAISKRFSWTSGSQFEKFCSNSGIPYQEVKKETIFKNNMIDKAFLTEEYTYDAVLLKERMLSELQAYKGVEIRFSCPVIGVDREKDLYSVTTDSGDVVSSKFVLNATYSGSNYINQAAGFNCFDMKYELCEIILCETGQSALRDVGITVMDGPFFSIMPFGKTGLHSLTSVTFTPHMTSYDETPVFPCQRRTDSLCTEHFCGNCNLCPNKPKSAWEYMSKLARKYLRDEYGFLYKESLYSLKPILSNTEIDDSRPTVIRIFSRNPAFISVLSGKINTVYDLDEVIDSYD